MQIKRLLTLFCGFLCLCAAVTQKAAAFEVPGHPAWKVYTSFFNAPVRTVHTADKIYIFSHQGKYHTTTASGMYAVPTGALFVVDKANPAAGMTDIRETHPLHGGPMRYATVNPRNGMIVAVYEDNGIDIVFPDGTTRHYSDLTGGALPDQNKILSVDFCLDGNDVWLGTRNGFLHIEAATHEPADNVILGKPVSSICRVGEKVIAVIDDDIRETEPGRYHISDFRSTGLSSGKGAVAISPLGKSSFMYLAKDDAGNYTSIHRAALRDSQWETSSTPADASTFSNRSAEISAFGIFENNVIPNRDGYLVLSGTHAYQVRLDKESGRETLDYTRIQLPSQRNASVGSWDFSDFTCYDEPGAFRCYSASGEGEAREWTAGARITNGNGPVPLFRANLSYNPAHGIVATNSGICWSYTESSFQLPLLVSTFKNGKWTNGTPCMQEEAPEFASDPALLAVYNNNRLTYPVSEPGHPTTDTLNPDILFCGSQWDGFTAVDYANPRSTPLMFGAPSNRFASLPGHKNTFFNATWGQAYGPVHIGGFDTDNNLWFSYSPLLATNATDYRQWFCCWTPAARREALASHDINKAGDFIVLHFDEITGNSGTAALLVLRHKNNRNKLLFSSTSDEREIYVIDHNGTLTDQSDDKVVRMTRLRAEDGHDTSWYRTLAFHENPVTGEIIMLCANGTYRINLSKYYGNEIFAGSQLAVSDGNIAQELPGVTVAETLCFDEYGRTWIGTQYDGVYGFSTDGRSLIAHYTADNSGLPDNCVTGLAWNPETKTLFIASGNGIAEVNPEAAVTVASPEGRALSAWPQSVNPGFTGTVAVYNVPDAVAVEVCDHNGDPVTILPQSDRSITFWNLLDKEGKPVPSGRYTFRDPSGICSDTYISIVR